MNRQHPSRIASAKWRMETLRQNEIMCAGINFKPALSYTLKRRADKTEKFRKRSRAQPL